MNAELDLIISSLLYALPFEVFFGYYIWLNFFNKKPNSREVERK